MSKLKSWKSTNRSPYPATIEEETPVNETPMTEAQQPVEETNVPAVQEQDAPQVPVAEVIQVTEIAVPEPEVTVVKNTTAPLPTEFEQLVHQLKADGSPAVKGLINSIESYMETMAPGKPLDPDLGAQTQFQFWKTISHLVEGSPQEEFRRLWSILLMYVNQYKGERQVFNMRYVFRFSEYWNKSTDELNAFQRIVNILLLTSDPKERSAGLRQVVISRSLDEGFSENARQRLIAFYQ